MLAKWFHKNIIPATSGAPFGEPQPNALMLGLLYKRVFIHRWNVS